MCRFVNLEGQIMGVNYHLHYFLIVDAYTCILFCFNCSTWKATSFLCLGPGGGGGGGGADNGDK